jgi:hypothetical protein
VSAFPPWSPKISFSVPGSRKAITQQRKLLCEIRKIGTITVRTRGPTAFDKQKS